MRLRDHAVLVNDVGDAAGVFVRCFFGGAVGQADLVVGIAEEREGEAELLREFRILFGGVEADAEDQRVLRRVLFREVPEPGTFERSAGCVGLRIKPEDDLPAAEVVQTDAVAVVIGRIEIGGWIADIQHSGFSSKS